MNKPKDRYVLYKEKEKQIFCCQNVRLDDKLRLSKLANEYGEGLDNVLFASVRRQMIFYSATTIAFIWYSRTARNTRLVRQFRPLNLNLIVEVTSMTSTSTSRDVKTWGWAWMLGMIRTSGDCTQQERYKIQSEVVLLLSVDSYRVGSLMLKLVVCVENAFPLCFRSAITFASQLVQTWSTILLSSEEPPQLLSSFNRYVQIASLNHGRRRNRQFINSRPLSIG